MIKNLRHLTHRSAAIALCLAVTTGAVWADNVRVKLATTMGDIVVEVFPEKAPKSAENFLQYVKAKQYDGVIFHRVIKDFMIQTGGMNAEMWERPTRPPIPIESRNGLSNERGSLAMARTADPNSASAQFFINVANNDRLNAAKAKDGFGYAVFGKVVSGMDVVDKIRAVQVGNKGDHQNVPLQPILITTATLVTK